MNRPIYIYVYRQLQLLKRSQESPLTRSVCVVATAKRTNGISLNSSVCVQLDLHIHTYINIYMIYWVLSVLPTLCLVALFGCGPASVSAYWAWQLAWPRS